MQFIRERRFLVRILNRLAREIDPNRFPFLAPNLAEKPRVFRAPPLDAKLLSTIKLISPHIPLRNDEASRDYWESDQNAACWGEMEAIRGTLERQPKPKLVLEIGPGLGRSVVFLSKQMEWRETHFDLYEGNGQKTKYTELGPRFTDSFCGSIDALSAVLRFNGIEDFTVHDAANLGFRPSALHKKYDLVYSFFAVGYHWSLEHFVDELELLLHDRSLAIFTVPTRFEPFERLKKYHYRIVTFQGGTNHAYKLLFLSKSADVVQHA